MPILRRLSLRRILPGQKYNIMCILSTLQKMANISAKLSELSVERMNIIKANLSVGGNISSDDGMEYDENRYIKDVPEGVKRQVVEVFIQILQLLSIKSDSVRESITISENARSYLEILSQWATDLPGYKKMPFGEDIMSDFKRVKDKLGDYQENDLLSKLIVCKQAIFE